MSCPPPPNTAEKRLKYETLVHILLDGRNNIYIGSDNPNYVKCMSLVVGDIIDIDLSERFGVAEHIQQYRISERGKIVDDSQEKFFLSFRAERIGSGKSAI
jgi:hypothetical protein